jgi:hypothetical protein
MMTMRTEVEEVLESSSDVETGGFPGLCRVCGGVVPRAGDQTSCTPSICSEQCLARAIVEYWAAFGVEAQVSLRDGFARLEGLRGILPRTRSSSPEPIAQESHE